MCRERDPCDRFQGHRGIVRKRRKRIRESGASSFVDCGAREFLRILAGGDASIPVSEDRPGLESHQVHQSEVPSVTGRARVFYLSLSLLGFLQVTLSESQQESQQAYGTARFT